MLIGPTVVLASLPALSFTVPTTCWFAPSPVRVLSGPQTPATAVCASAQTKRTVTGPAYQPAEFGAVVVAPLMVGARSSTLTVRAWPSAVWSSTLPALSVLHQVMVWTPPPTENGSV